MVKPDALRLNFKREEDEEQAPAAVDGTEKFVTGSLPADLQSKILAETFAQIFTEAGGETEIIPLPLGEVKLEARILEFQERGDELLFF